MYAYSPKETLIVGTLETLSAVAPIDPASFTRDSDGKLVHRFDLTSRTSTDWENQQTVIRAGNIVFVDEDGEEFLANEIRLENEPVVPPCEPMEQTVEDVLKAAHRHGQGDDPDHEVGDLQDALRLAWSLMTEKQRKAFLQDEGTVEPIALGGALDQTSISTD